MNMSSNIEWFLTDSFLPIPHRQGVEDLPIASVIQLEEALRSFARKKGRVVVLSKRLGPGMFIGMDGEYSALDLYPVPASHKSFSPRPKEPFTSEDLWVISEGEPASFEAGSVMPTEHIIRIAAHFMKYNTLPDWVEWRSINGEQLNSTAYERMITLHLKDSRQCPT